MNTKRMTLILLTAVFLVLVSGVFAQDSQSSWLRFAHLVNDGEAVDVWIDGKSVLQNIATKTLTDYVTLDAGNHQVAVSPTGKGTEDAIIAPMDVDLTAGNKYTIAAIGQAADKNIAPLLIDETKAFEGMDIEKTSPSIFVNNLSGNQAIDVIADGETLASDIAPGHYGFAVLPTKNYDMMSVTTADDAKAELFSTPLFFEPSVFYLVAITGKYPGELGKDYDVIFPEGITSRNTIDFLKGFSGLDIGFANFPKEVELPFEKQHFNFDTLLKTINQAGLTDMLRGDKPYTLFAPTDDAFAALPAGTLDKWMTDSATLKTLVQNHLVDGAMTMGDLLGAGFVTTVGGSKLDFSPLESIPGAFAINGGVAGCGCNYHTANGYVFVLDHVLTPQ